MPFAVTLDELLAQVAGAELTLRRQADFLGVTVLVLPTGRQVITVERVYRDGTGIILDPTPEEVEIARNGDLWQLWNSERRSLLAPGAWDWFGVDESPAESASVEEEGS